MTKILPMRLTKLAAISVALPYASYALAAETDPAIVQKAKSYVEFGHVSPQSLARADHVSRCSRRKENHDRLLRPSVQLQR